MDEVSKIKKALTGPLEEKGYLLYEVRLLKKKDGLTLEVTVDRDDPISLDDIVKVSELINPILDKEDPISSPYTLDVSSLGGEKPIPLTRLEHYRNRFVHLHLSNPHKGLNDIEGDLLEVDETRVKLQITDKSRKKSIELARQDIDKARLAIKF